MAISGDIGLTKGGPDLVVDGKSYDPRPALTSMLVQVSHPNLPSPDGFLLHVWSV